MLNKKEIKKDSHKCTTKELKILGDFWTLAIIQTLVGKEKRFSEIARGLPNASPTTLTNRLKKLEDLKIVKRKLETVDKQSVVYYLTDKGKGIIPVLKQIRKFAEKFL